MNFKKFFLSDSSTAPNISSIVKWLWNVSSGQRRRVCYSFLLGIGEVACSLGFVWSSKRVIDIATGNYQGELINWIIYTTLILGLQLCFTGVDIWLSGRMPVDAGNNLRHRIFDHILHSRWSELEKYHTGDILNRVSKDIDDVVRLITITFPALLVTFIQFVASFVFLAVLDSLLAWILVVIIPLFLLSSKIYVSRMRKYNRDIRTSDSRIQSIIQESIQHHVVIKTLERSKDRLSALSGLQGNLRGQVLKRTRLSLFSRMTMSIGMNGGYLLVFFWGAIRLSRGDISFGTMTAFLQLVGRVQRPAYDLTQFVPAFIAAFTSAERLMELEAFPLEESEEVLFLGDGVSVVLENVGFEYDRSGEKVLDNLNMSFPSGTTTAVLGETGAGKTTFIRLLLSIVSPQEGRILLKKDVSEIVVSPATRANFVYVPQGNTLFSGTIRENLLLGAPDATEERLCEVLRVAVADFVFSLPEGLDTVLSEKGGGVSEGQAQRIAIARALLRKGAVLVFDEATSALDTDTEHRLLENLKKYNSGKTAIFITHHPDLANSCDRIYRI